MLANKPLLMAGLLASLLTSAQAEPMTVGEATRMQSEIARAELNVRLEETRKKLTAALPAPVIVTEQKEADEVLTLLNVYGIGGKLRGDFLFRGAVVTLSPGGKVGAVGWMLESLTPTQAVMVKRDGKVVVRRSTLYLSGLRTDKSYGSAVSAGTKPGEGRDGEVPSTAAAQSVPNVAMPSQLPAPMVPPPGAGAAPAQSPAGR